MVFLFIIFVYNKTSRNVRKYIICLHSVFILQLNDSSKKLHMLNLTCVYTYWCDIRFQFLMQFALDGRSQFLVDGLNSSPFAQLKKCAVPAAQTTKELHVVGCGKWPSAVQVNGGCAVVGFPGFSGFSVVTSSPGGAS